MGDFVRSDEDWAEREERVERLPTAPLAAAAVLLPIACGDIVCAGVAEHIVERVAAGDVLRVAPDDDGEFAFVVHFIAAQYTRQQDRLLRVLHGGGRFHKEHGVFWDVGFRFLGMAAVVQPDAKDDRGVERRKQRAAHRAIGVSQFAKERAVESGERPIGMLPCERGLVIYEKSGDAHRAANEDDGAAGCKRLSFWLDALHGSRRHSYRIRSAILPLANVVDGLGREAAGIERGIGGFRVAGLPHLIYLLHG